MPLVGKSIKSKSNEDFAKVRAWEYAETWNNPFSNEDDVTVVHDDDDDQSQADHYSPTPKYDRKNSKSNSNAASSRDMKKKQKKKRRKHHRKKVTDEEASQADSLLSSLLSEDESEDIHPRFQPTIKQVVEVDSDEDEPEEQVQEEEESSSSSDDCDSMNVLTSTRRTVNNKKYTTPYFPQTRTEPPPSKSSSSSPEQIVSFDEDELNAARRTATTTMENSMHVHAFQRGDNSSLEEDGDDVHDDVDDSDDNDQAGAATVVSGESDDDTNILNPFDGIDELIRKKPTPAVAAGKVPATKRNPFEENDDDGEEESDTVATEEDQLRIETTLQEERGVTEISPKIKSTSSESDTEEQDDEDEDEKEEENEEQEEEEEDIVESSKRLLRMCDQRIQYQQHNEEVQALKATIEQMRNQAEAMAEQLRRAIETKCDLVLAQNEMERRHEQNMIVKDQELKEMRMYIQEVLEGQAKTELNFMNEIASLARKLEIVESKHKKEIEEKNYEIGQMEEKIKDLQTDSARSNALRKGFRSRITDSNSSIGSHSTSSKHSNSNSRSRKKIYPW